MQAYHILQSIMQSRYFLLNRVLLKYLIPLPQIEYTVLKHLVTRAQNLQMSNFKMLLAHISHPAEVK